ncbi:cytochrome P450 71A1 [Selaginella moellendorffii]|uniref:cytochrome P450 71A1 n=1 Tax=Selaginella moellendorffii TaxID=88036 RepID=UPI000D1C25CF|nr:cytochrome P450 71A1 [Selaginella moellendorffii]|eukprot:XP_024520217.1 cytochrome P450 71A1 [Selaginella moellendorffii]
MDLTLSVVVSSLLLLFILAVVIISYKSRVTSPPGPWGLPLIGHLHLLARMPLHRALQSMSQKHGPIVSLSLGMRPAILISAPALARELFTSQDVNFPSKPYTSVSEHIDYNFRSIGTAPYGEYYSSIRKLCLTELFTARNIDSFSWIRREELSHLLSAILSRASHGQALDLRKTLSVFSFNSITGALMSKRYLSHEHTGAASSKEAMEFKNWLIEVLQRVMEPCLSNFVPWYLRWLDWKTPGLRRLHAKVDKFLQMVVEEHKKSTREQKDFLDILLKAFGEEEAYAKANLLDLMVAGTETSVTGTEWLMAAVIQEPRILKKAQQELHDAVGNRRMVQESDLSKLGYLDAIIKESLRRYPIVPIYIRECQGQASKLGGYDVPKGTIVIVNSWALGMDPVVWENPTQFLPERFLARSIDIKGQDFELLPFGSGRRRCPGMPLGLRTMKLLVANLIHGFDWSVEPGKIQSMEDCFKSTCIMKHPLQLVVTPRLPKDAYTTQIHDFFI